MGHSVEPNRALLSVSEASALSGYTRSHVNYLINQGYVEAVKIGNVWVVYEDSLRQYMETPRKPGPKPGQAGQISDTPSTSSVPKIEGNAGK